MKVKSNNKIFKNSLKNSLTLRRAPTSNYNYEIFNRASTKIDLEKAHYEAQLLLDEEEDSITLKDEFMFQRIDVNIFQFFCHLFESIDWLYLILGIIGISYAEQQILL